MKRVKLTITNNSGVRQKCLRLFTMGEELPVGVFANVEVVDKGEVVNYFSYKQFIDTVSHKPFFVNVYKSSNNRRLDFYSYNAMGVVESLTPHLTIDGEPRPKRYFDFTDEDGNTWQEWEYKKKWDSKKWNIADTKELFILDFKTSIELDIRKGESFELQFKVSETHKIN